MAQVFEYYEKYFTMKKIITLLVAVGAFAIANAQYRDEARTRVLENRDYHNGYGYMNPREAAIARVTREYDNMIRSVWTDPYLSHGQKERRTHRLQKEKERKIYEINRNFGRDRDRRRDW